jgi:hypothetical protein
MQCMMKEVCAQCLQRHVDPQTGEETGFVFSCFNQDQRLDEVDFKNLADRLRANSVQEKLSNLWLDHLLAGHDLPHVWVLGWSFGTDLALMHGCDPLVEGAILLSPPLRFSTPEHLATWAESGKPLVALVPEHDDYLQPDEARERFAAVPQAEVVGIDGAKHLWVGDAETVLDLVVQRVAPGVDVPLPREWDGPMETADTSAYADRTTAAFKDVPR